MKYVLRQDSEVVDNIGKDFEFPAINMIDY